jgi:tetratricopeptide (TPR) repeat protein
VALKWERLQIPIRIAVEHIDDLYVAQMKRELRNRDGFSWNNWEAAAQYCLTHKTHLADGLHFAEQAVGWEGIGVANFQTLTTLAQLQIANGKRDDAAKTIARALEPSQAGVVQIHQFGRALQGQDEDQLALQVFQTNAKRNGNVWPTQLGLARGYSKLGDHKKALAYAKKALAQAPDEPNRKNVESLIQQWESAAKN